jgi:recombination protein RecR
MAYPRVIETLIEQLMKLPGVGRRSAERMVFWILNHPSDDAELLSLSIRELKHKLCFCKECNNFAEKDLCPVCSDASRDESVLCVVENPKDALAIEKTGAFKGRYYVLLGSVSPTDGHGPDDLNVGKLLDLVQTGKVREVVLATDADMEGELTSLHLTKVLAPFNVRVSRIGIGLPAGGAVEFADMSTLSIALRSRREVADDRRPAPVAPLQHPASIV